MCFAPVFAEDRARKDFPTVLITLRVMWTPQRGENRRLWLHHADRDEYGHSSVGLG